MIAVCVATLKRTEGLRRLLEALKAQTVSERTIVVVVDNDVQGSAEPVCADFPGVVYAHQPVRGIPQARNTALRIAKEQGADWVAFVDDDEQPDPAWLAALRAAADRFRAEVVQGRVVPRFESDPPAWILKESLFERIQAETGDLLPFAATNATLASMKVFDAVGGFEEAWALIGGTDTLLFARASRAGFRTVWCDEAVVFEDVGADRANLRWLCRRALRIGITQSLVKRALFGAEGLHKGQAVLGLKVALGGFWRCLPGTKSPCSRPMALRMGFLGLGLTLGAMGVEYAEYAGR